MSTEFNSGVQMSLNGNLEVFPLEEVLRLLARSRKSGCLRVESSGVQGRIFLTNGTLSLATTANDVELRNKLVSSGLIDESAVRRIELSGSPVSDSLAEDVSTSEWADFVREESVEGLYRIRRTGRGSFDFVVDLAPRYPTGQSFDSEVIMSESDRRALEWEDIETVLPRLDTVVRMVPALEGDDSVTLGPATWRILAALGGGSSTTQVAGRLMWSHFRTAREMATLVRNGLVTVSESEIASDTPASTPSAVAVAAEPEPEVEVAAEAPVVDEPEFEPVDEMIDEDVAGEVPHDEPVDEVVDEPVVEDESIEETTDEADSDEPVLVEASGPEVSDEEDSTIEEPTAEDAAESFWGAESGVEPEAEVAEEMVAGDAEDQPEDESEVEAEPEDRSAPTWWRDDTADHASDETAAEEPASPWSGSQWNAEAPAEEAVIEATPWGSPVSDAIEVAEAETEDEVVAEVEDIVDDEDEDRSSGESGAAQGWWAETMGAAEEKHADSDSEADRFLESVFSSLSGSDDEQSDEEKDGEDETGFGMGLLRRRRLGATARDVDNDR